MIKVRWTPVVVGLVLTVILGFVFEMVLRVFFNVQPPWGGLIGFLIATIYVGYTVGGDYRNGVIHGGIVGVLGVIIVGILPIILGVAIYGPVGAVSGLITLIKGVLTNGIIGAIGGIIGVLIKNGEIKQKLEDKREGNGINGYLVCDNCQGSYELQPGESPDMFTGKCECGGDLKHVKK